MLLEEIKNDTFLNDYPTDGDNCFLFKITKKANVSAQLKLLRFGIEVGDSVYVKLGIDLYNSTVIELRATGEIVAGITLSIATQDIPKLKISGDKETFLQYAEIEIFAGFETEKPKVIPESHNNIYRGKYLGNEFSFEQYVRICMQDFSDFYIGDYWGSNNLGSIKYRIAAINYFKDNKGIIIVAEKPDSSSPSEIWCPMYYYPDTLSQNYGYYGSVVNERLHNNSNIFTTKISRFFYSTLKNWIDYVSNSVVDNKYAGYVTENQLFSILTEEMIFGHSIYGIKHYAENNDMQGVLHKQLPLYRLSTFECDRHIWLRDFASNNKGIICRTLTNEVRVTDLNTQSIGTSVPTILPFILIG